MIKKHSSIISSEVEFFFQKWSQDSGAQAWSEALAKMDSGDEEANMSEAAQYAQQSADILQKNLPKIQQSGLSEDEIKQALQMGAQATGQSAPPQQAGAATASFKINKILKFAKQYNRSTPDEQVKMLRRAGILTPAYLKKLAKLGFSDLEIGGMDDALYKKASNEPDLSDESKEYLAKLARHMDNYYQENYEKITKAAAYRNSQRILKMSATYANPGTPGSLTFNQLGITDENLIGPKSTLKGFAGNSSGRFGAARQLWSEMGGDPLNFKKWYTGAGGGGGGAAVTTAWAESPEAVRAVIQQGVNASKGAVAVPPTGSVATVADDVVPPTGSVATVADDVVPPTGAAATVVDDTAKATTTLGEKGTGLAGRAGGAIRGAVSSARGALGQAWQGGARGIAEQTAKYVMGPSGTAAAEAAGEAASTTGKAGGGILSRMTGWLGKIPGVGKAVTWGGRLLRGAGVLLSWAFILWDIVKGFKAMFYAVRSAWRVSSEGSQIGVSFINGMLSTTEVSSKIEGFMQKPREMGILGYVTNSLKLFWKNIVEAIFRTLSAFVSLIFFLLTIFLTLSIVGAIIVAILGLAANELIKVVESFFKSAMSEPYAQVAGQIRQIIINNIEAINRGIEYAGQVAEQRISQAPAQPANIPPETAAPPAAAATGTGTGTGTGRAPQAQPAPAAASRRDLRRERRLQRLDERATRRESRGRGPGRRLEGRRSRLEGRLGLQPGERRASLRESLIKMANDFDAQGLFEESDMIDNLLVSLE